MRLESSGAMQRCTNGAVGRGFICSRRERLGWLFPLLRQASQNTGGQLVKPRAMLTAPPRSGSQYKSGMPDRELGKQPKFFSFHPVVERSPTLTKGSQCNPCILPCFGWSWVAFVQWFTAQRDPYCLRVSENSEIVAVRLQRRKDSYAITLQPRLKYSD